MRTPHLSTRASSSSCSSCSALEAKVKEQRDEIDQLTAELGRVREENRELKAALEAVNEGVDRR